MNSNNFVVIQGWMCNELDLKGNELLVYALIYGFSQDGISNYHGGRQYIADTFNISLPTVDKALKSLLDKHLLIKIPCENHSQTDVYSANISSKETLLVGSKETLLNNISNNNINKKDNTNVLSTAEPCDVKTDDSFLQYPIKDVSTEKKEKKPNLYSSCLVAIDEFTDDEEVRECLKDFLNMRLANKDKPFGLASFKGMLKKLRGLTTSKKEVIKIITQAVDRCYLTFYPISTPKKEYKCPEIKSPGNLGDISDEEYEEAMLYGKKF